MTGREAKEAPGVATVAKEAAGKEAVLAAETAAVADSVADTEEVTQVGEAALVVEVGAANGMAVAGPRMGGREAPAGSEAEETGVKVKVVVAEEPEAVLLACRVPLHLSTIARLRASRR